MKYKRMRSNSIFSASRSFHIMTKPIGPLRNLDCKYYFYLEKEKLFSKEENYKMSDAVQETYARKYFQSQNTPEISFAWQGGEPTSMEPDFFRKVFALQRRYAGGRKVHNSFQTKGTNLDDKCCEFFARENFLVGLSVDGPEYIHNRYRADKGGNGSFERVFQALEMLKQWRIEFNTLTCVSRHIPKEAVEIYTFLRSQRVTFMQFIPDGEAGLNYLFAGYKMFFKHIDLTMRKMAALVQKGSCRQTLWLGQAC